MGPSHQACRHSGLSAFYTSLNCRVDDSSPGTFDFASGAFKPCDLQPTMPLHHDSGSNQGWSTIPSRQQCYRAPKPTVPLEPPHPTHEAPRGCPVSPDTSNSDPDPDDYMQAHCPIRATVPVAGIPVAIFTPNSLEAAAHLLNSIDVTAELVAITCTDVIEVLLTSYEKKAQYEKTIVVLHQQLTDVRARIDSLECKLRNAHNRPLVSGSTQTDPPPGPV